MLATSSTFFPVARSVCILDPLRTSNCAILTSHMSKRCSTFGFSTSAQWRRQRFHLGLAPEAFLEVDKFQDCHNDCPGNILPASTCPYFLPNSVTQTVPLLSSTVTSCFVLPEANTIGFSQTNTFTFSFTLSYSVSAHLLNKVILYSIGATSNFLGESTNFVVPFNFTSSLLLSLFPG